MLNLREFAKENHVLYKEIRKKVKKNWDIPSKMNGDTELSNENIRELRDFIEKSYGLIVFEHKNIVVKMKKIAYCHYKYYWYRILRTGFELIGEIEAVDWAKDKIFIPQNREYPALVLLLFPTGQIKPFVSQAYHEKSMRRKR